MSTYILGFPGAAIVTNADGTVALVPGIPITQTGALEAAVLPSFVHDTDAISAPAVVGRFLRERELEEATPTTRTSSRRLAMRNAVAVSFPHLAASGIVRKMRTS